MSDVNMAAAGLPFRSGVSRLLVFLGLAVAIFAVYSNVLESPFVFDDLPNIVENDDIKINSFSLDELRRAATSPNFHLRPIPYLSFAVNYLANGLDPVGFHAVNILIHLVAAWLVFLLVAETLELAYAGIKPATARKIAFTAALLWAVHPVQIESVTFIVQRITSLATLFCLGSLYFYVSARRSIVKRRSLIRFSLCVACALLAFLSKETAAILPFMVLLYEWFFFQELSAKWLKKSVPWLAGALLTVLGVSFLYLNVNPLDSIMGLYDIREFTPLERVMTQWRVVVFYVSLLILPLPSRLSLSHDFTTSTSLLAPPETLACLLLLVGALIFAVRFARRWRLCSFAILWFLGTLVIESSFIGLEMAYEHRLYLPSVFPIAVVVAAILQKSCSKYAVGAFLGIAIIFGFWAHQQNEVWNNEISVWADVLEANPEDARAHTNVALYYKNSGDIAKALYHAERSVGLKPQDSEYQYNYASVLSAGGMPEKAIPHYLKALEIKAGETDYHNDLAGAYFRLNNFERALFHYNRALLANRQFLPAWYNVAMIQLGVGEVEKARRTISSALRENPTAPVLFYRLGLLLKNSGLPGEACPLMERAYSLDPRPEYLGEVNNCKNL